MGSKELPFTLETELERTIAGDPDWREGMEWGKPRKGHPEGAVKWHVRDVLANVDRFYSDSPFRSNLRLIALVHDTFKFQVDRKQPACGENHHGMRARRFSERYLTRSEVLDVIELHDEAYNSWQKGYRDHQWDRARERAMVLIDRLAESLDLYVHFYRCDNETDGKSQDCRIWFEQLCEQV